MLMKSVYLLQITILKIRLLIVININCLIISKMNDHINFFHLPVRCTNCICLFIFVSFLIKALENIFNMTHILIYNNYKVMGTWLSFNNPFCLQYFSWYWVLRPRPSLQNSHMINNSLFTSFHNFDILFLWSKL